MIEIYDAGWQILKFRFLTLLSVGCVIGGCWVAWDTFIVPTILASEADQIWVAVSFSLGLAFIVSIWVFSRIYIRAISFDPKRKLLNIRTAGLISGKILHFPPEHVFRSSEFSGRFANPGGVSVNAPGFYIWIKGRRLPLILDGQGKRIDARLLKRYVKVS